MFSDQSVRKECPVRKLGGFKSANRVKKHQNEYVCIHKVQWGGYTSKFGVFTLPHSTIIASLCSGVRTMDATHSPKRTKKKARKASSLHSLTYCSSDLPWRNDNIGERHKVETRRASGSIGNGCISMPSVLIENTSPFWTPSKEKQGHWIFKSFQLREGTRVGIAGSRCVLRCILV